MQLNTQGSHNHSMTWHRVRRPLCEGWWPGVVSAVRRGRKPRYSVTFPLFREEVELPTSLVRRRRNFVCGTRIDAQQVVSVIISFNTILDALFRFGSRLQRCHRTFQDLTKRNLIFVGFWGLVSFITIILTLSSTHT
jgi:hypothetical protein